MGSSQSTFDINIFDAFQNEVNKMQKDFPFLSLKVLQKGNFANLSTLKNTIGNIFTENSIIMKQFLKTHLPQTADVVNPMIFSIENTLKVGPGEFADPEHIKKGSMGVVQHLIRSVIAKLYMADLKGVDNIKLSETMSMSLNAIEKLSFKFSGYKFKLNKGAEVNDEFIQAYLAEYQTISDYIPKTKKVLGMLLKKYEEFPIMKRYIHLMDSMVSLSQIWTDKSVVIGGSDGLFGSSAHETKEYLTEYKTINQARNVKRFKTFIAIAIPALLGLSGIIFALAKGSDMKEFLDNGKMAHILLWLASMIICYMFSMAILFYLVLGIHRIFPSSSRGFNDSILPSLDCNVDDHLFGDSEEEDDVLDIGLNLAPLDGKPHQVQHVFGGRSIEYPDEQHVFTGEKGLFNVSVEETGTLSNKNIIQFNQSVMDIYATNSDFIQEYLDSVSEDVDPNLKNIMGAITTEITANPKIDYNSDGSPKIGNLLKKSVKLMLLGILKKFYYSKEHIILNTKDTVMLSGLSYISQKIIKKTKTVEPVQVSKEELDAFFQNSDDPKFAGKVEFIAAELFKKYENQPFIQNYLTLITTVSSALDTTTGGANFSRVTIIFSFFLVLVLFLGTLALFGHWDVKGTIYNMGKKLMESFSKTAKLFSVDGREIRGGDDSGVVGGLGTVLSLVILKNIMLVIIVVSLLLLVYLSYSIICKMDNPASNKKLTRPEDCSCAT